MPSLKTLAATVLVGSGFLLAGAPVAEAQKAKANCVAKAGEGTGGNKDSAMFQAYEAILQATDWGMWSAWMVSSQKVGEAPGYKVSNLKSKCSPGGLGQTCRVQAELCK